ncbi:kinase-like domain-containing protein [Cokeromyces recurvatus]|uniref:kinase-like domain-containing protein n=1 Tax=Cokeromyces recurvatus TaxID=90255 RepID=UPI002220AA9D|nr:kinase-like domain-containing protein [Cokeromyces recurvatus]KAI7901210.1 kinase-like domain-containing protein [Cokeromyces recurvatus]
MTQVPISATQINYNNTNEAQEPILNTNVDDPSHPLHHHRRVVTDFDYGDILGEGSYSTVLIGRDKRTGKHYAIKRLDKAHIVKNNKVKYVMIERDALSRMNHPGIIKLYWTFKDNRSLYFVLDLARNGELYTYIRRLAPFDLEITKFYAAELLLAIEHIHNKGVIHRDIKPENILLDDNLHIKVTDFGSAKIIQENDNISGENEASSSRSFVGTAEYVPPELLRSDPVSKEADLWAFGCVIYQMLSGKSPFKAATDYLIFQKIKNLEYTIPDNFPQTGKDIIEKLLVSDPERRLGSLATGGIQAIKEHAFFEGIDWENLFTSQAPPLRDYLEKEVKANPIISPTFDFDQGGEEEEEEEEMWFNHKMVKKTSTSQVQNPFNDHSHVVVEEHHNSTTQHLLTEQGGHSSSSSSTSPPYNNGPSNSTKLTIKDQSSLSLNQQPSIEDENANNMSKISSVASSTHSTRERLGEQAHPPWIPHLYPNESVIKAGQVTRKRGFISKKRNLILTNRPRLLYLDEGTNKNKLDGNLRCEIPWTPQLLPELKGRSTFCIRTPGKTYTFIDRQHAQDWVNTINSMLVDSFGITS